MKLVSKEKIYEPGFNSVDLEEFRESILFRFDQLIFPKIKQQIGFENENDFYSYISKNFVMLGFDKKIKVYPSPYLDSIVNFLILVLSIDFTFSYEEPVYYIYYRINEEESIKNIIQVLNEKKIENLEQ